MKATANPYRAKALSYLRSGRVLVWSVGAPLAGDPAIGVRAVIRAAADMSGQSVPVRVALFETFWNCEEHPGENSCAHRLAVQMVTGHGQLEGRWTA